MKHKAAQWGVDMLKQRNPRKPAYLPELGHKVIAGCSCLVYLLVFVAFIFWAYVFVSYGLGTR